MRVYLCALFFFSSSILAQSAKLRNEEKKKTEDKELVSIDNIYYLYIFLCDIYCITILFFFLL